MTKNWLCASLLLLLATPACGTGRTKKMTLQEKVASSQMPIDQVYRKGLELLAIRKFVDARQYFRVIEAQAPDSSFFAEAKLAIADSYFFDRSATYLEASVEYKSFMLHFPNHPSGDYAQYQYAMCFFTEIERADRDQTSTLTAYSEFKNLVDRFPGSPYASRAREKMELCLLRLADHEYTVGHYYFRRGKGFEISAESRFKYIINNYEGQFDPLNTYFHLAESLWRLERYAEANKYYEFLNRNFPASEYQPFVEDKLLRYGRIMKDGYDPGEELDLTPIPDQEPAKGR